MERRIKNWMFFGVAMAMVEVGGLLGSLFGLQSAGRALTLLAAAPLLLMAIRILILRLKK